MSDGFGASAPPPQPGGRKQVVPCAALDSAHTGGGATARTSWRFRRSSLLSPLSLSALLKDVIVGPDGETVGSVDDVIVRLDPNGYPPLTGLVVRTGSRRTFVPATAIASIGHSHIVLESVASDLRPFERRDGEVLLKRAVLGHRLIDVERGILVRAYDVAIAPASIGWVAAGLDLQKRGWLSLFDRHEPLLRDWKSFEALIGHEASLDFRSNRRRSSGLKPAQIAELIENAAIRGRRSEGISDIVRRMGTDDAGDSIVDPPQGRRRPAVDRLRGEKPEGALPVKRYQVNSAGGLMGLDYVAVDEHLSIRETIELVRRSATLQPEALTTIYSLDADEKLNGSLSLVRAIQADPSATVQDVCDPEPLYADLRDDIIDVANTMADYNLLVIPVVDERIQMVGVITVDDVLGGAIPHTWRLRDRHSNAGSAGA